MRNPSRFTPVELQAEIRARSFLTSLVVIMTLIAFVFHVSCEFNLFTILLKNLLCLHLSLDIKQYLFRFTQSFIFAPKLLDTAR